MESVKRIAAASALAPEPSVNPATALDRGGDGALAALGRRFARDQVDYCVLHGWGQLPAWSGGDFDLAIDPRHLEVIEAALETDCQGRIVQLLQHEITGFFFVARCDGEPDFTLVDAATDYRRDGLVYLSTARLLAGARGWNGFRVAAPAVEFAYLLIKKISKLSIPAHQRERLAELRGMLGAEAAEIAHDLFGPARGARLIEWIDARRWEPLDAEIAGLRRALRLRVIRRDPLAPMRYWWPELGRRWRRWRNPSGLLVAVLGPDGAGKSTLIEGLRSNLGGAFRHTSSFHLRPTVLGRGATGPPVTDPHGAPPRARAASAAKIALYVAQYILGYAVRLRPALAHTTLIFSDRYFDDLIVDPRRYRYGGPEWWLRLARRIVPRPDLWIVLDVPEKTLLARKQEVAAEELSRQRRAYRDLAAQLPNAFVVDGANDPGQVAREAAEVCIDHLHTRYWARRARSPLGSRARDLDGLAAVVLRAGQSRFAIGRGPSDAARGAPDTFVWLRLGDGRGFLLPRDRSLMGPALELYNAHSWRGRAVKTMLRAAAGRRWLIDKLLVPVVATASAAGPVAAPVGEATLFDHIRKLLRRDDLGFAVSTGTPGPHCKTVIQVLTRQGEVLGYAKVAANPATGALVRNEVATIQRLGELGQRVFDVPRLLTAGQWNGYPFSLQSAPAIRAEAAPDRCAAEYLEIICQLSGIDSARGALDQSSFWRGLTGRIRAVRHPYFRRVLDHAAAWLAERMGQQTIVCHLSHGDFAPWNVRRLDGKLYVFDWEYASRETPAGWDLCHFFTQTLTLLRHYSPARVWREFGAAGEAARWAGAYLDRVELDRGLLKPLYLLYLAGELATYADERAADLGKLRRLAMLINLAMADPEANR
ncbi:MAG TPA: hypothetical protein VND20_05810 [Candidatus Binataceae bacterium]|nr:hypothetical protein [Candidatus Binataceae bacterium]